MLKVLSSAARAVAMAVALFGGVFGLAPRPALAVGPAFRLEAVGPAVPVGREAAVVVRLVDAATGAPVANAVVFRARLDMAPEGMGDMAAVLKPATSPDSAVYRFTTTLTMPGRWLLTVQAKVPGVAETVRAETIITAVEPAVAPPSHQHQH